MANDKVILLDYWSSSFGEMVTIAPAEKEVEYKYEEERQCDNNSSLLMKLNPVYEKNPVLFHNLTCLRISRHRAIHRSVPAHANVRFWV